MSVKEEKKQGQMRRLIVRQRSEAGLDMSF